MGGEIQRWPGSARRLRRMQGQASPYLRLFRRSCDVVGAQLTGRGGSGSFAIVGFHGAPLQSLSPPCTWSIVASCATINSVSFY